MTRWSVLFVKTCTGETDNKWVAPKIYVLIFTHLSSKLCRYEPEWTGYVNVQWNNFCWNNDNTSGSI